jgi:hypothetical protein
VNALTDTFGVTPLTLAEGLGRLVDEMPERLPSEGTGSLEGQRYWADIRGSALDADALFELFRREFRTLPPEGCWSWAGAGGADGAGGGEHAHHGAPAARQHPGARGRDPRPRPPA